MNTPLQLRERRAPVSGILRLVLLAQISFASALPLRAHAVEPSGIERQPWQTDQIARAYSTAWRGRVVEIAGRRCIQGRVLLFDVHDALAYDIDEDVDLTLEVAGVGASRPDVLLVYEKNGQGPATRQLEFPPPTPGGTTIAQVRLERARFANDGAADSDFSIVSVNGVDVSISSIRIHRNRTTPAPGAMARIILTVTDENLAATPALVGLYDERDRLPLPSEQAIPIRIGTDLKRIVSKQSFGGLGLYGASMHWPAKNQSAFYVNARYEAEVPVGQYRLVVSKGPEYRILQRTIEVKPDGATVEARLARWDNLAARGWFSGDDHIHYTREDESDDRTLMMMSKAEGLNVSNILQMGNVANAHFRPYSWEIVVDPNDPQYVLAPGQEDPRTGYRGHTIGLHLREAVRDPENYLLYDLAFRRIRAQGGLTGYAHAGWQNPVILAARRGLALDVPEGLIDFVEVLQGGSANLQTWFNFLNLGFKLTPSAGTDFPAVDQRPGAVRNYVKIEGEFTAQSWFDAFKAGHTFVTNGPMLEFAINDHDMGAEVRLAPGASLKIKARARLNPDLDQLDRIELIEQGQVVKEIAAKEGSQDLSLECEIQASHGTWFVLQARGKRGGTGARTVAVTAPIYVHVDNQGFWKKEAVPAIVSLLKQDLDLLSIYEPSNDEAHETRELFEKAWKSQQTPLHERVEKARAFYDRLASRATRPD